MNIIIDSCSIINLLNGEIFDTALALDGFRFHIGPMVQFECSDDQPEQQNVLSSMITSGRIIVVEDSYSLEQFQQMKSELCLGDGETESIILAKRFNCFLSTDDRSARRKAEIILGENKIIGSLYLIREMVRQGLIDCDKAVDILDNIKSKGAFLPASIGSEYLCQ